MKANDYITRHEAIRALQINFDDYGGARERAAREIGGPDGLETGSGGQAAVL